MLPARNAAEKRGAKPASPSETALVCTLVTQPAPIRISVAKPETGTPTRRRLRTPRRINALASATEGRELSGGKASMAPSGTSAASASRLIGFMAFSFTGHATGRSLRKLGADVLAGLG